MIDREFRSGGKAARAGGSAVQPRDDVRREGERAGESDGASGAPGKVSLSAAGQPGGDDSGPRPAGASDPEGRPGRPRPLRLSRFIHCSRRAATGPSGPGKAGGWATVLAALVAMAGTGEPARAQSLAFESSSPLVFLAPEDIADGGLIGTTPSAIFRRADGTQVENLGPDFSLSGDGSGDFSTELASGQKGSIKAKSGRYDYETRRTYELTVTASVLWGTVTHTDSLPVTVVLTDAGPPAPAAPTVRPALDRLTVAWAPPPGVAGIDGYDLRYRKAGQAWMDGPRNLAGTVTSAEIAGTTLSALAYEVQVRARKSGEAGPWSEPGVQMQAFSIADVEVIEGDGGRRPMTFTVSAWPAVRKPVELAVRTVDDRSRDSARAGEDYEATSATLRFPAGAVSATFSVAVHGDRVEEWHGTTNNRIDTVQTFSVELSSADVAVALLPARATGTIRDDDRGDAPWLSKGVPDRVFHVGQAVDVTLPPEAPGSGNQGPYSYALLHDGRAVGETYTLGGLSFDPATRRLSGTAQVPGEYALTYEVHDGDGDRNFNDAGRAQFRLTVLESPLEVSGPASLLVWGPPGGPFPLADRRPYTVLHHGEGAASYAIASSARWLGVTAGSQGALANGRRQVELVLTDAARALPAGRHTATLTFTETAGGAVFGTRSVTLIAVGDEPPTVPHIPDQELVYVVDGGGYFTLPPAEASSGNGGPYGYTLSWVNHQGQTVEVPEQGNGEVSFDPLTRLLTVAGQFEGTDFQFIYTVHDGDGNRADSDAAVRRFRVLTTRSGEPSVGIAPAGGAASVTEGAPARFTVTASAAAPAAGLTVNLLVAAEGDYGVAAGPATVAIPADATEATFEVGTADDGAAEMAGSVTVSVAAGDGYRLAAGRRARVAVADNDFTNTPPVFPASVSGTRSLGEEHVGAAIERIVRDIGTPVAATDADGHALTYSLSGPDADLFAIGAADGRFRTRINARYDYETKSAYAVTVTARDGYGGSASVAVTVAVTDVDEPPLAPGAPTVAAVPGMSDRLTVTWPPPPNTGRPAVTGYALQYRQGSGGPFTAWTRTGGALQRTETITGLAAGADYEVQVRATNDDGAGDWSAAAAGRTDAPSVSIAPEDGAGGSVTEGSPARFTVTASFAPKADLEVTYDAASTGAYFSTVPAASSVTLPAGATEATVVFPTVGDGEDEEDGSVTVTLTAPGDGSYTLGSPVEATVTIGDDDEPPAEISLRFQDTSPLVYRIAEDVGHGVVLDDMIRPALFRSADGDVAEGHVIQYELTGEGHEHFEFGRHDTVADMLRLRTKGSEHDYETRPVYVLTATATTTHLGVTYRGRLTVIVYLKNMGPPAPDAPTVQPASDGLTVSWTPPPGAAAVDGYDLRYRKAGEAWMDGPQDLAATGAEIAGTTLSALAYEVQVRASIGGEEGPWSESGVQAQAFLVDDAEVTEGNGGWTTVMTFTVSASPVVRHAADVSVGTRDDSAVAGEDYEARSETLRFLPGTAAMPFAVTVNGDVIDENHHGGTGEYQAFFVELSSSDPAVTLTGASATGTIRDDDHNQQRLQPALGGSVPDRIFYVGQSAVVTLPAAVPGSGNGGPYRYALLHDDRALGTLNGLAFDPTTRRLSGMPEAAAEYTLTYQVDDGDRDREDRLEASFELRVIASSLDVEGPADFYVRGLPGGPFPLATRRPYTVVNHAGEPAAFAIASSASWLGVTAGSAGELAGGRRKVELVLTSAASALPAGRHDATLTFTETPGNAVFGTRQVTLFAGADQPPTLAYIPDREAAFGQDTRIALPAADAGSGNGGPYSYALSWELPNQSIDVPESGPATMTFDPETRVLTIAPEFEGDVYALVYTVHDGDGNTAASDAAVRRFNIRVPRGTDTAVGIAPADGAASVTEGSPARFTLTASSAAPADGLTVKLLVAAEGDHGVAAGRTTITIPVGETQATFAVETVDDDTAQGHGSVRVTVAAGAGYRLAAQQAATVAVIDDDSLPELGIAPADGGGSVAEGLPARFTLTASVAQATGVTVNVRVATEGDFGIATGLRTVEIPAEGTQATFEVETVDDNRVEPSGSVTATIEAGDGYRLAVPAGRTATVAVADTGFNPCPNPVITIGAARDIVLEHFPALLELRSDCAPRRSIPVEVVLSATGGGPGEHPGVEPGDFGVKTGPIVMILPAKRTRSERRRVALDDDRTEETSGTLTATLRARGSATLAQVAGSDTSYTVGSPSSVTVELQDNETHDGKPLPPLQVWVDQKGSPIDEGGDAVFVVHAGHWTSGHTWMAPRLGWFAPLLDRPLEVTLKARTVGTFGYGLPERKVVIPPGQSSAAWRVTTVDDEVWEDDPQGLVEVTVTGARVAVDDDEDESGYPRAIVRDGMSQAAVKVRDNDGPGAEAGQPGIVADAGRDETVHPGEGVVRLEPVGSYNAGSGLGNWETLDYTWTLLSGTDVQLCSWSDDEREFWRVGDDLARDRVCFRAPEVDADTELVVRLRAEREGFASDIDTVVVTVSRYPAPRAHAGPHRNGAPGETVSLDGTRSVSLRGDPQALNFRWQQESGPAVDLRDDRTATPRFLVPENAPGGTQYRFGLTVTDAVGGADSAETAVTVSAPLPVVAPSGTLLAANAGPDLEALAGTTVTLQGRDSVNPHGAWHELTHLWAQREGPTVTLSDRTRGDPSFDVPSGTAIGTTYRFELTVTDKDGESHTDSMTVNVVAVLSATPPTAEAGPNLVAGPGETVTLQGTGSTNPHGKWWRMAHRWRQTAGPDVELANPTKGTPSFTVPDDAAPGTVFAFELKVTDKDGETDTDTMTVTVSGSAPAVPVLTVDGPHSATEGGPGARTALTFTLRLDRASTQALSPLVRVLPEGSATYLRVEDPANAAGGDGTDVLGRARADREAAGPVTFAAGETEATLVLTVLGDAAHEPDETVVVEFRPVDGLTLPAERLVGGSPRLVSYGTILNDDALPPVADAGADVADAAPGATVTLGTEPGDGAGTDWTYAWSQTSGPTVALQDADAPQASFTVPADAAHGTAFG
ncbi:MAG: fibronectin type III domain-containing protein, partial [Boseongicola sp.]|nr:fibronectin type III domain-containing protein [Boseongicola sp.]